MLLAGNGRKIGKTTLACAIIQAHCQTAAIIGLKVTTMYANDTHYHGKHDTLLETPCEMFEETNISSEKDTSRMLRAGASKVFYIRCHDAHIREAFQGFLNQIDKNAVIICESGSLRSIIEPGLFLYIEDQSRTVEKEKHRTIKPLAHRIVRSENLQLDIQVSDIAVNALTGWQLLK